MSTDATEDDDCYPMGTAWDLMKDNWRLNYQVKSEPITDVNDAPLMGMTESAKDNHEECDEAEPNPEELCTDEKEPVPEPLNVPMDHGEEEVVEEIMEDIPVETSPTEPPSPRPTKVIVHHGRYDGYTVEPMENQPLDPEKLNKEVLLHLKEEKMESSKKRPLPSRIPEERMKKLRAALTAVDTKTEDYTESPTKSYYDSAQNQKHEDQWYHSVKRVQDEGHRSGNLNKMLMLMARFEEGDYTEVQRLINVHLG